MALEASPVRVLYNWIGIRSGRQIPARQPSAKAPRCPQHELCWMCGITRKRTFGARSQDQAAWCRAAVFVGPLLMHLGKRVRHAERTVVGLGGPGNPIPFRFNTYLAVVGCSPRRHLRSALVQAKTVLNLQAAAIERYKLTRCELCGEWQNGDWGGGVLCICAGVRCKWCGERFHRPISDYFDEKTRKIWHVPWFGQLAHESKPACRRAREEKQRRLAVHEECIDCGRRVLAWEEWEPVEIEVDEWGRRCTQCRNTALAVAVS